MSGRAASAGSLKSRMEGLGRGAARAFLWHRPCSTDLHEPRSSDDPRVAQRGLPRERFVTKEAETLSDAECLGLLFGVQSSRTHRADQAQALFAAFGSLAEIADREVQEVDWIGRLGVAKPARLGAATELCRRLRARPRTGRCGGRVPRRRPATSARTSRAKRRKCSARRSSTIRTGSSATSGSPKGAGRRPPSIPARSSVPRFLEAAAHLVLVHNYPSTLRDLTPFKDDIHLTRQLSQEARLLGLRIHDHVIFGHGRHVSLTQRGVL